MGMVSWNGLAKLLSGRRRTITKLEAAIKQLVNKAASGELRAMQLLTALARSAEETTQAASPELSQEAMSAADKKIMEQIIRRFEDKLKGGN